MGKFGNVSLLVCQCKGQAKVIDAEKMQKIEHYLIESFKAELEADRQYTISIELGDKAIELILSENIHIDDLLIKIREKVLSDGDNPK